jgi:acyl-coenzyme A synthetase/AMP-(fatty) acid ligase
VPSAQTVYPKGISPAFILAVLRAWRAGAVLCPLEEGQTEIGVHGLPTGCVHLKTTSASTGQPRLIAFTGDQLAADAAQIVATMGLRREWANVGVVSLAHSYGFSNLVLPLLLHGIPLVLAGSPLPETVRRAAALVPDSTLAAVPALWRAWFDADSIPDTVRLAISAGAPLPLGLEEEVYQQRGLKIHNFYGASECGGIAYDQTGKPRLDPAGVGSPLQGVELSTNEQGLLRVKSQAAGLTYWPVPSANLGDGIYDSGDLAELKGGLVFLRGRQTDLINVAGRKVSPESIERVLAKHPEVRDCLVFGVPSRDADRADLIVACVVARTTTAAEPLRQHLLAQLPAWQVPREWWFLPTLETNRRGKLSRWEWRQRYLATKG